MLVKLLKTCYNIANDQVPTPALAPLPHLAELSLALNNIKVGRNMFK